MRRRDVLAGIGGLSAAACATRPAAAPSRPPVDPPVRSSAARVTRTVVGLRPFRPSGFRLEAERFGETTVVHNYGHGGCGVTLSWGTSAIAADAAAKTGAQAVAVLGGGVMGLTTALILARRGAAVTLYADKLPPETTSNVAGALWLPSSLYNPNAATEAFLALNWHVTRAAQRAFLPYVNRPGYGVYWTRHSDLRHRAPRRRDPLPGGDDLYPALEINPPNGHFGYAYEERYHTLMIDPDFYLEAILRDALVAGARVETRRFETLDEVLALPQRTVVNCTGLGAGALFGDEEITPIRGQLTHLLPQPEIDYSYIAPGRDSSLYMFPRRTGLVLGGSHSRGDWSLEIDEGQKARMVQGHAEVAARLSRSDQPLSA